MAVTNPFRGEIEQILAETLYGGGFLDCLTGERRPEDMVRAAQAAGRRASIDTITVEANAVRLILNGEVASDPAEARVQHDIYKFLLSRGRCSAELRAHIFANWPWEVRWQRAAEKFAVQADAVAALPELFTIGRIEARLAELEIVLAELWELTAERKDAMGIPSVPRPTYTPEILCRKCFSYHRGRCR